MARTICATICALLLGTVVVVADQGRGNGAAKGQKAAYAENTDNGGTSIHFSVDHVRVIREYYAPQRRPLPPGLRRKYARTGSLPPGWQKKMEPLPVIIERDLPRLSAGYSRGVIDGHAVIYNSRSGTIIDVAVLF